VVLKPQSNKFGHNAKELNPLNRKTWRLGGKLVNDSHEYPEVGFLMCERHK
jgi:hypothetical protein